MNLCLICLRTDRLLKFASNVLEEFHGELCDFSAVRMTSSCLYCSECEYLLIKFYKFKNKCVKALKIYHNWLATKSGNKQSLDLLYTMLPPSPLGIRVPIADKDANFIYQEMDIQTDLGIGDQLKLEDDHSYSSDNIKIQNVLKKEYIPDNVTEHIDSVNDENETEKYSFENLDKLLKHDPEQSSEPNTEHTEVSDKIKKNLQLAKKKEETDKNTEVSHKIKKNLRQAKLKDRTDKIKSKSPSKKNIAYKKETFDRKKENDKMFEPLFDIEYLTTQEKKLEEFERRQTYECYVKAEHKCNICCQVFKSLKYLKYHTDKWHNEAAGKVCCPICKIWHSKKSTHHLTHTAVFKCKICPLVTYHRDSMQNHFAWHKGKQYHCGECDTTYKSKSVYRSHMGKAHRRGRNVCERCGRGFYSPAGLAIHKQSSSRCTASKGADEGTVGVRCDDCDVTLPSQQVYEMHIFDVHELPRAHGRPLLTTNSAGLPVSTRLKCLPQKPRKAKCIQRKPTEHTCRVCNAVGRSFGWLQLHFKREHPNEDLDVLYADRKKHLCDTCGNGFSSVYALRDHMNIHTGARPYACDLCPKTFRNANLMREHRLRHFPSKFTCTYCEKQFKTKANLYCHMKIHTGEKDYKCDICGKGFLHNTSLKEHVQGVHFNIRRVKRGGTRADAGAAKGAKRRKTVETEDNDFSSISSG